VNLNDNGFTLIEFLVAILILTVGLLGLLQTVNFALRSNLENQLRQEAIMLGDEQIAMQKVKPFDAISTTQKKIAVSRPIYGGFVNYSVVKNASFLGAAQTTKNIDVEVRWKHRGQKYSHSLSSLVSN